ncbi:MAG: metallophosphoesterase family protein [Candidatus Solibacter usitatus]|nr:metallophosphoesterase family protein [Candidatus Solibacter usitatus]
MRYLILSDIHANWEGLAAVLESAAGLYDRIVCCGDLIGYGADPNPVVDWTRANIAMVVRGNHDRACTGLDDLEWFNPVARAAATWTLQALGPENADYVRALPKGPLMAGGFALMHGSPMDEDQYVVEARDAAPVFSYLEAPVAFFGHTHLQGGFVWIRQRARLLRIPADGLVELDPECAYLLNPGSVGQPRDGDPRAAYIVYNPEERIVQFHRVPYDVATAQNKIRRAGLPQVLADRLAVGR